MFNDLATGLLDLLFPPLCILCKNTLFTSEKNAGLCLKCQSRILKNKPPFCSLCCRPVKNVVEPLCKTCRHSYAGDQKTGLHFDRAWAACIYNDPLRRLIHLLKYGQKTSLRHYFVETIFQFLEHYRIDLTYFDLIVPIPLHPTRLRERGYNQAQLLAELIAAKLTIPLSCQNLQRRRHTPNQARLTPKERWTNIYEAFKINQPKEYKDKNLLLVDDLLTTGATCSEAARALKEAGAAKVMVLTLAITAD